MSVLKLTWNGAARGGAGELEVRIDDQRLADWIRPAELPFARAEGSEDVAGAYAGLTDAHCPDDLASHFLGSDDSHLFAGPHDKTVLVGCDCGDVACWPLMAHVKATADSVTWSDFEQPHRHDRWSYAAVEPLVFDRTQYEAAVAAAVRERHGARRNPPGL